MPRAARRRSVWQATISADRPPARSPGSGARWREQISARSGNADDAWQGTELLDDLVGDRRVPVGAVRVAAPLRSGRVEVAGSQPSRLEARILLCAPRLEKHHFALVRAYLRRQRPRVGARCQDHAGQGRRGRRERTRDAVISREVVTMPFAPASRAIAEVTAWKRLVRSVGLRLSSLRT